MKLCKICHTTEIPDSPRYSTCSLACKRKYRQQMWRGVKPSAAALDGRRKQARELTESRVREAFGPELTERDRELFKCGVKLGYAKGYSVGFRRKVEGRFA